MDFLDSLRCIWEWLKSIEGQVGAAWVQAIGALLAILITQRIASRQTRRLEENEKQKKEDSIRAMLSLIFRGEAIIRGGASIKPQPLSPPPMPTDAVLHSLNVVAGHLERLEILTHPSTVLVRASLSSANAIRRALDVYQRASEGKALNTEKLIGCANELRECGESLMSTYQIEDRASI